MGKNGLKSIEFGSIYGFGVEKSVPSGPAEEPDGALMNDVLDSALE